MNKRRMNKRRKGGFDLNMIPFFDPTIRSLRLPLCPDPERSKDSLERKGEKLK